MRCWDVRKYSRPMSDNGPPLLEVRELVTGYGRRRVLSGVSFSVKQSQVVAMIGHNGAGKSTLLKAVFGLLPIWSGSVFVNGEPTQALKPREMMNLGVALVPQGNRVFNTLTVRENLTLATLFGSRRNASLGDLEHVFALFPALRECLGRRAGTLSGGEKQMLAVGNALAINPRILLLDEPSLGLSPSLAPIVLDRIHRLASEAGVGVLLVEQKVRLALQRSHMAVALRRGEASFCGSAEELLRDESKLREVYL